jgi:putative ABC transport system substrate-binding protein
LAFGRSKTREVFLALLDEFVIGGGLRSYGVDQVDISRRAATNVDRILRGEKPCDLPVRVPVKYEMAVNRRTRRTW